MMETVTLLKGIANRGRWKPDASKENVKITPELPAETVQKVRTAPSKLGRPSAVTGNAYQLFETTARMLK